MARLAPYLSVAGDLRDRIRRGEWRTGARLPSRARLAEEYGVGRNVTQRAVDLLIVEGLLEGRAGSGTYVRVPRVRRRLVRSLARDVSAALSLPTSGELSTAPIRGSLLASAMDSLATSSDWSTMRAGPSTGSTV